MSAALVSLSGLLGVLGLYRAGQAAGRPLPVGRPWISRRDWR